MQMQCTALTNVATSNTNSQKERALTVALEKSKMNFAGVIEVIGVPGSKDEVIVTFQADNNSESKRGAQVAFKLLAEKLRLAGIQLEKARLTGECSNPPPVLRFRGNFPKLLEAIQADRAEL